MDRTTRRQPGPTSVVERTTGRPTDSRSGMERTRRRVSHLRCGKDDDKLSICFKYVWTLHAETSSGSA
ncbi:unnamed protein product [Brassica rapa]|uniref:Uncharacterized protein n=1 Tax=Brassica campestris TaxID=3711 RepID=A0A8D9HE33_BRACM|nr:unnamed protein product [Brassica rapa]